MDLFEYYYFICNLSESMQKAINGGTIIQFQRSSYVIDSFKLCYGFNVFVCDC